MGQILLVRHGQASFGSADYDRLSEIGFAQARVLGAWFARNGQRFTRAFSGSMLRQRQTAMACLEELGSDGPPFDDGQIEPGLNEYDHHEVLLRHRPDFADPAQVRAFLEANPNPRAAFQTVFAAAMERWMCGEYDADYRETWPGFRSRCVAALERLVASSGRGESIVVFTSGGVIGALCQHLLDMSDAATARLSWGLVNCGVTRVLFQPEQISLNYLNNHAHLECLGQAQMITFR